jgi:hypothetical protein
MMAFAFVLFIVSCEKDDPTPEPQATCDDGIQNGDETGIDCGGSCSACEEPITMATPNLNAGVIDMEEDGMGPDFSEANESNEANPDGTWGVFGSDAANKIQLEIVDNPNTTGNASSKVLKIEEEAGQEPWQGFFFDLESKVSLTAPNTAISVDVHSLRAGQKVLLKLEDSSNSAVTTGDIIKETTGEGWETITYNLSADYSGLFDRVVFIMDFGVVNDAQVNHYIDNIRVSEPVDEGTGGGGGTGNDAPTEGPTAPTADASNVVSMFSDSYDDVTVDTWLTSWSNDGQGVTAELEDIDLNGNMVKKYSKFGFVGIEASSAPVDASSMTHINFDYWTPDGTVFKIKLVDWGADKAYDGGDDSEHELALSSVTQGEWVSVSIPLSDFTGMTGKGAIAQYILVAEPWLEATYYIDNMYFSNNGGSTGNDAPTDGPTAPSAAAADVISLFSDSYDDVTVDTWLTEWSNDGQGVTAELAEVDLNGNNVKKYSKFGFVGIETSSAPVDASSMTHFNFDYWTSNATVMKIKLVDWGADKGYDGGDDSEHEIALSTVTQGEWVSVSIPLSDFSGMTATEAIAQYILVAEPWLEATVYIDNVFFSKE